MFADLARVPLRPLPDRPRVLALEWNLPFHIDMAQRLAEQHGWDFVYWVGDGPMFGQAVQVRFPDVIFHDTVDARYGRPPAALANLVQRPFDEELAQSLAYEQTLALKMMDRIELEESFSYHERVRLFHRMVAWWSALLDHIKPDIMIIPTAPHVHYDYIVYALCRRRGIRTAMFENGSVPGILLRTTAFEEGFPEVIAEYRRLLSLGDAADATLSESMETYLATTRGGYVPTYGQALYEQIYERKPGAPALAARFLNLRKLLRVSRYPAYLKKAVQEMRRPPPPQRIERRLSGHLRGRFIKAGEVGTDADIDHGRWVEQRREELQRDYETRVTVPDFSEPYIYVPLHVQPERSTAPNGGIYDHAELVIEALARAVPGGWLIYVKEHPFQFKPWQVGERGRRLSDYAAMSASPNVRLLPVDTKPFDLIDNAQSVATITGTSGWEALARGIPVLCFGIAWYQGCDGVFDVRCFSDLKRAIKTIVIGFRPSSDRVRLFVKALENVGFRGFLDIDTQGAAGISEADNILALANNLAAMVRPRPAEDDQAIELRLATRADAALLLAWRNDPESRRVSRDTEVVSWPVHEAWLSRTLTSPDRQLRIAIAEGKPVGVVRADRSPTGWELSWTVAPEARGRGVGRRMLGKFVAQLDGCLTAVVRNDNAASAAIAAAVGFTRVGPTDQIDFDLWARG